MRGIKDLLDFEIYPNLDSWEIEDKVKAHFGDKIFKTFIRGKYRFSGGPVFWEKYL